ncbi:hypothetical protein BDQ17DRAFT_1177627, partial [Cyathus striatus]
MVVRDVRTWWNYTHAIDKWTFDVPVLRGFVLPPESWEYLEQIVDVLEVSI